MDHTVFGRRVIASLALVAVAVIVLPAPARAGGGTFDLHDEWFSWGERVVTRTLVNNDVKQRGSVSDGPWFAYLRRDAVVKASNIADDAARLGRITFERESRRFFMARLAFTVPEVPPGKYWVQICNSPCTHELGDLVAGWFWIARTPIEATLLARIQRIESRIISVADRTKRDLRKHIASRTRDLGSALETDLGLLREAIDRINSRPHAEGPTWPAATAAFVVGAVAAAAFVGWRPIRRRRGQTTPRVSPGSST